MQERVYRVPIQDVDQLRQGLVETWAGLQQSQSVVDEAIDQWRKRLGLWERASIHRVVTLNTLYSIASTYFATEHNRFFSEPPTIFEENNVLSNL